MKTGFLLITANVGSLFEEGCLIHDVWLKTIINKIVQSKADFLAIHMQEVGGKNYEEYTTQVSILLQKLADELRKYNYKVGQAYLDINHQDSDNYTALGSLYFILNSMIKRVKQYDFRSGKYDNLCDGFKIYETLDNCNKIRKVKFPKHFWPNIRWSRKGYMLIRFKVDHQIMDFVNVHLFHDDSNITLVDKEPSIYRNNRKRAFDFVLNEVEAKNDHSAVFIFGDLNFRLNPRQFFSRITEDADIRHDSIEPTGEAVENSPSKNSAMGAIPNLSIQDPSSNLKKSVSAVEFRKSQSSHGGSPFSESCVLRIEKKKFDYVNNEQLLNEWRHYLEDDDEVQSYPDLYEIPIHFPPTYPWSENPEESGLLMKTRAPAWCDRILMNSKAYNFIRHNSQLQYDSLGKNVCMGDHKPVTLIFTIDISSF